MIRFFVQGYFFKRHGFFRLALLVLALAVGFSGALHAEEVDVEQSRGRLPDGRAFRTDVEGNQLVDYIAELEVTVEDQNRRIQGLELEVEGKTLQNDPDRERRIGEGLTERDLLGGKQRGATIIGTDPARQRSLQHPAAMDCQEELSQVNDLLSRTKLELEDEQKTSAPDCVALQGTVQSLERELELARKELAGIKLRFRGVAGEALTQGISPSEDSALEPKASFSQAKEPALDSIKGRLLTDLNRMRGLIRTRDMLFSNYRSKQRSVEIKLAELVSSRGETLQAIDMRVQRATTLHELSEVKKDIKEIDTKLKSDIAVLKRMENLSR